jgi:MinD-like ATPase involved in chromosome partitioning or flagellar assembly
MLTGFTSGKGAPGATLALANIGASAVARGENVLALDLDPLGGVLGAYLGGDPRRGLWPLAYAGAEPTPAALREQVQVLHRLALLGGLPRASDAAGINLADVARAGARLAPHVLVDAGRLPGPGVDVLAQCERIIVVVVRDPVGILAGEQALQALGPGLRRRVAVLVTGSTAQGELAEVGELLESQVLGGIPWDPDEVRRSREEQRPVAGKLARAYERLAELIVPSARAEAAPAPSRKVVADGA